MQFTTADLSFTKIYASDNLASMPYTTENSSLIDTKQKEIIDCYGNKYSGNNIIFINGAGYRPYLRYQLKGKYKYGKY